MESRRTLQTDRKDNAMYFDSYEQMNSTGENTIAFIRAVGAISLMAMQKTAELQFTFVSTQMESALEQLKLLSNFESDNYFLSAESILASAYGTGVVDITRKTTTTHAASGNEPGSPDDRRFTTTSAPKIKPAKRKIRKKNS